MNLNIKEALSTGNSDKESLIHGYGFIYELLIKSKLLKNQPLSLLEIGMFEGDSLITWDSLDIFNKIVGLDICNNVPIATEEILIHNNVDLIFEDAYNINMVNTLNSIYSGFDIIIDDGSHTEEHQLFFIYEYFKLLNPNGVLVCEDIAPPTLPIFTALIDELSLNIINLTDQLPYSASDSIMIFRTNTV